MLNPDQAGRLRNLIQSKADVSSFDGFRIEQKEVKIFPDIDGVETIFSEPFCDGKMFVPERIFGTPYDGKCLNGIGNHTIHTSDKVLFKYKNATIIGNNAIMGDFGLGAPSPISEGQKFDKFFSSNQSNAHGFVVEKNQENFRTFAYFVAGVKRNNFSGTGMFFHDLEAGNYGSFLFRILPQMLFISENKNLNFDFYVIPSRTSWFMEAIQVIGLPNRPVFSVNEIVGDTIEELMICNSFDNEGWLDENTLLRIHALTDRVLKIGMSGFQKFGTHLYVSRRLNGGRRPNYRRLLNEEDVVKLVEAHGFKTIYPEALRFVDQVMAFSAATSIIGPSGSGMLNAMFTPPGARVLDIESFSNTVRQHAKIYASTGKTYGFLFGQISESLRAPIYSNWHVDTDLAQQSIGWVLQRE